jgi:internalin A
MMAQDLFAGLKCLQTLSFSNTNARDAGLKELAGLKSLQTLLLSNTKVTDAAVAELQKALPKCKIRR